MIRLFSTLASTVLLTACLSTTSGIAQTLKPSFDCTKAVSSAEKAVCANDNLAALDMELNRLYSLASTGEYATPERRAELKATQRGWVGGRDECWKADTSLEQCVAGSYVQRIAELRRSYADARSNDAAGVSSGPFPYVCTGMDVISVTFINVQPAMVSLLWADHDIAGTLAPNGSGARYIAEYFDGTYEFKTEGDTATLTRPDTGEASCKKDSLG